MPRCEGSKNLRQLSEKFYKNFRKQYITETISYVLIEVEPIRRYENSTNFWETSAKVRRNFTKISEKFGRNYKK